MHQPVARRPYGLTGIEVSVLGLGAAQLGDHAVPEAIAASLLDMAQDAGVNLIDTAPSYGESEARLGRALRGRRKRFVLSTKLGYGVPGTGDWTGPCIAGGIERALQRLNTDVIDLVHLHSCPGEVATRDDILQALADAKTAGKVRAIAYSGENADLLQAARSARFDGLMASLNLFDQRVVDELLAGNTRGFIAKRALANAPWRYAQLPVGDYCEPYWRRLQTMQLAPADGMPWGELALRFVLAQPGVSALIVGTAQPAHWEDAIAWAARGALDAATTARWRAAFKQHDNDWIGQV